MASIRHNKRRDGSVAHQVVFRHAGKQTSATFDDLGAATRFAKMVDELGPAEAIAILDHAPTVPSSLPTLGQFAHSYIDSLTGIQPDTRARYHRQVDGALSPLALLPLVAVSADHVRGWVNAQEASGAAATTIANRHGLLSAILADAVTRGMIDRNPAAGTRLPRGMRSEMVFLTPDQFALLRSVVPDWYKPLVTLLASAGLRWSEATALTVADLHPDAVTVSKAWKKVPGGFQVGPPKTRRANRTVTLAPDLATMLNDLTTGRARGDLLFTTPAGTPVRHNVFSQYVWGPVTTLAMGHEPRKRAGRSKVSSLLDGTRPLPLDRCLEVRPRIHDLRHTAASWMIAAGLDLVTVQYMLGHESVTMTADLYGHLLPERRKAAASAIATMLSRASV